jgi:hypothetical protein
MAQTHLTEADIQGYLARRMQPAGILRVHDHLAECRTCADAIAASRRNSVLPWAEASVPRTGGSHIDEDDLVQFALNRLDAARHALVQDHIEQCSACRDAIEDLRIFEQELEEGEPARPAPIRMGRRRHRVWPLWALAAAGIGAVILSVPRLGQRQPAPAQITYLASILDGSGTIGITSAGELAGITVSDPGERTEVEQALRAGVLPPGPAAPQPPARRVLRGASVGRSRFEVLAPTAARVLSDRPDFQWSRLPEAVGYEVTVFDDAFNEVAHSGRIAANRWQPETPLPRGRTFVWQVVALRGGERFTAPAPPDPAARFQVIDRDAAAGIVRARSAPAPSHLLLAVLYARQGLRDEARAELDALSKLNPDSQLAASLRRSLGPTR